MEPGNIIIHLLVPNPRNSERMVIISSYLCIKSYVIQLFTDRTIYLRNIQNAAPEHLIPVAAHNDHADDPEELERMKRDLEKL